MTPVQDRRETLLAIALRNRRQCSTRKKFNIFVHSSLAAVNRYQIRRVTIGAGILRAPILSHADKKAIAVVPDELTKERRPAPYIFQDLI